MANVIKYKTSQPTRRGLRKGNTVLGIGDENYGPTSITGYVNGITPPDGGYVVYILSSNNDPAIYVAETEEDLVSIANTIGGSVSTVANAKTYLAGLANTWILDNIPNNAVTDSLILDLDSTNLASYPGSGNTWYDLSGNENNTNCATFNYNGQYFYSVGSSPGQLSFSTSHTTTINDTFIVTSGGWTIEELIRIDDTTYPESSAGTVVSSRAYGSTHTGFDWQHGSMHLSQLNVDMSNKDIGGSILRDAEVNLSIDSQFQTYGRWILRSIYWDRDNDTCGVYYNGIFQDSGSISSVSGYPLYDGGGITWGTLYGWQHDGARAAMRIYNKVLSESEVKQNHYGGPIVTNGLIFAVDGSNLISYENGSSTAYSLIGSNAGTLNNGVSFSDENGGVLYFDGSNDYIEFTDNYIGTELSISSAQGYTLEAWIKVQTSSGTTTNAATIVGQTSSTGYGFQVGQSGGKPRMNYGARSTSNFYSSTFEYNEWIHVTLVKLPNAGCRSFLNGVVDTTFGSSLNISSPSNGALRLGNASNRVTGYYDGAIGPVRIYNRDLTDDEVLQNYNAQKARFL